MKPLLPRALSAVLLGAVALVGWTADRPAAAASASTPVPVTTASSAISTASAGTVAAPSASSAAGVAIPGVKPPDMVRATPVPGIFEVHRGADIIYMTRDGRFAFTGDLYQVASHDDLTEARRRDLRRELIDAVPESRMVVFSPPQPKYTVTVFTDVDCTYCRAFHRQIADYNRLGVRVRYVFFPRTGPNTESWYKAEQVWCSTDRRAALTRAKLGEPIPAKLCGNDPVAEEYALGKAIGLEGTPGIVASNGTLVGGYLPPDQLV
ncbi:MAG TPA: DsbC family protein, partial [Burkholderiales bacterium]|nr:DsbC family protein [Burkholderiales bacterium]